MAVFLGIDPGLATVGFGVIRLQNKKPEFIDAGIIKTSPGTPLQERLLEIKKDIDELIRIYQPDGAGVEELFFAKNVTNAIQVAHARGVILERLAHHKIPLSEWTPLQVKNNICGHGQANKAQMQEMVKRLLDLNAPPNPDDAADALGIAILASRLSEEIKI